SGTGPLSLEDKKRLAAEQEQNIRLRTQSPLAPGAGPAPTASSSSASIGSSFMSPMTSSTASLLAPAISPSSGNRPSSASSSAIDLTAFLPPPSVQNPVIRPASSGAGGAGLINNFQQPMGAGYGGLGGLVAPPASANPVLRPMTASGFSGNSNFGANNSFGGMGGGSNFGNVSGSNLSGALGQQQQQPKVDLSAFDSLLAFPKKDQQPKPSTAKDPFADLLG
uniref:Uncharacterized protein n=1 Tax=Plectus sambesii TaxID=2011161 RepID=A0A914VIM8_9BILA